MNVFNSNACLLFSYYIIDFYEIDWPQRILNGFVILKGMWNWQTINDFISADLYKNDKY